MKQLLEIIRAQFRMCDWYWVNEVPLYWTGKHFENRLGFIFWGDIHSVKRIPRHA